MTDTGTSQTKSYSIQQEDSHDNDNDNSKDNSKIPIIYPVTSAGLSPYTREHYEKNINRFLAHFQIKDIEPLKEYSLPICKQMIIDYVIHLREKTKLSRSSIKLHLAGIRHLFFMIREDEFPIKWTKINIELPPHEYTYRDRGYSVEEIQKMLDIGCQGRLRDKVVILLLASAGGMRIGGIPNLKKCHLKEMYIKSTGEKTYGIRIYADSSEDYFTPCSPECASTIDRYFEERANDGEGTIKHDSPLIRNLYNSLSVKHPKHLSIGGVKRILKHVLRLSRVRENFEFKGQVKMSRGFRKFYKSEADLSGMLPATVELTQGHNIGIPGHYLRPKDTDILQDYEKVIDRITIDPVPRLKRENKELKNDYLAELGDLRQDVDEMKRWFTGLKKDSQKELVDKFYKMTTDKVQEEWYKSDEYWQWQKQKQKQNELQSKSENKKND